MRGRHVLAVLTILGLFLQAAAVVRHHLGMIGHPVSQTAETSERSQFRADFCHYDDGSGVANKSGPSPLANVKSCPICTGLCAAGLFPAPGLVMETILLEVRGGNIFATRNFIHAPLLSHPPGRGPPAVA